MEGRTIATVGGGDLMIGGGPPIDGLLHGWMYEKGTRGSRGGYGFILATQEVRQLVEALRSRETVSIKTFTGGVLHLGWGREEGASVACLWFYGYGGAKERACRLYEGAIEAAAEAFAEASGTEQLPAGAVR